MPKFLQERGRDREMETSFIMHQRPQRERVLRIHKSAWNFLNHFRSTWVARTIHRERRLGQGQSKWMKQRLGQGQRNERGLGLVPSGRCRLDACGCSRLAFSWITNQVERQSRLSRYGGVGAEVARLFGLRPGLAAPRCLDSQKPQVLSSMHTKWRRWRKRQRKS